MRYADVFLSSVKNTTLKLGIGALAANLGVARAAFVNLASFFSTGFLRRFALLNLNLLHFGRAAFFASGLDEEWSAFEEDRG